MRISDWSSDVCSADLVSHFMLESAGRVEVLRGPFSALYGNSSGGVISVSSADPPPHPQLSAGLDAGNDGLQRASLSWHAPWADGDGGVLVDGVHVDEDGFRDHSRSDERRVGEECGRTFGTRGSA